MVICNMCGEPSLNYIVNRGRYLCVSCALKEYKRELKELDDQFSGIDTSSIIRKKGYIKIKDIKEKIQNYIQTS